MAFAPPGGLVDWRCQPGAKVAAGQVLWQGEDRAAMTALALQRRWAADQMIFQDPVAAPDPRMTSGRVVSGPVALFAPGLRAGNCRHGRRRCPGS